MNALNFTEIILKFEAQIKVDFELLENNYSAYLFGSGFAAYRIKGKIFKIIFEGRDNMIEVVKSEKHQKYPNCNWSRFFSGSSKEFLENINVEISNNL